MKTKTLLYIVIGAAALAVVYMCWSRKEWLSDLGLGTGMLNYGIGPTSYEGFELEKNKKENTEGEENNKEGFCGACS